VSEGNVTREQIGDRVAQALVQALGVSRSDITPETSLAGDLEAESIDFLDIVFRLEKEFGIEVARGELFPQELLRDAALVSRAGSRRKAWRRCGSVSTSRTSRGCSRAPMWTI